VVEDLVSTGKSSLQVVDVLKAVGLQVMGMVAIFTYGFPQATEAFEKAGVPYYALTNYPTLVESAIDKGLISKDQLEILLNWREDPANWKKN